MTRDPEDFWSNRFHWCALAAGFLAAAEGRLSDSEYVKRLAYQAYESGAFRQRQQQLALSGPPAQSALPIQSASADAQAGYPSSPHLPDGTAHAPSSSSTAERWRPLSLRRRMPCVLDFLP